MLSQLAGGLQGGFFGLKIWLSRASASFVGEMERRVRGDVLSYYECRLTGSREKSYPMAYVDSLHTVCPPTSLSECNRVCCFDYMVTESGD
jgi:hypothetical protein